MEDLADAFNDMTGRLQRHLPRPGPAGQRAQPAAGPLRAAGQRRLPGRRRRPRDQQPAGQHRLLQRGAGAPAGELLRRLPAAASAGEDREVFTKYLKMIQEEAFRCKDDHRSGCWTSAAAASAAASRPTWRELVQRVLDVAQHLQNCKGKHDRASSRRPRLVAAWVNAQEIKSVVLNLVVNALDSMDEGGTLTIRLRPARRHGRAGVHRHRLRHDAGGAGEHLRAVLHAQPHRQGDGAGPDRSATASSPSTAARSRPSAPGPDQGSTFTVRLPLQPAEDAAGRAQTSASGRADRPA